jgi:preprotein translocase subunit SecF
MALISATLVVASLVGVFKPGLNLGIDFKGGSVMEVSTASRAVDLGITTGNVVRHGRSPSGVRA